MNPNQASFQLRIVSAELKAELAEKARQNLRSLNAEINARLLASLQKENAPAVGAAEAFVTQ